MLTHCNANAKIPNFRYSNPPCKVPPVAAALSRPPSTATAHISQITVVCTRATMKVWRIGSEWSPSTPTTTTDTVRARSAWPSARRPIAGARCSYRGPSSSKLDRSLPARSSSDGRSVHCLKWSKKEAGSLPQSALECPLPRIFKSIFGLKMASFDGFLVVFYAI